LRPREAPLLLPPNVFTNTWHPPSATLYTPKFDSDLLPPPRCSIAIDFQAFLVAPLGHRLATTVTDAHLRNSNHHKDLREAKTQEWRVMMTGRNNSVCPQGALQEAVEAAAAVLHDSCGPSRAQEATRTLLATSSQSPLKTSHQTPTAPISTSLLTGTTHSPHDQHKDATRARSVSLISSEHGPAYRLVPRRL